VTSEPPTDLVIRKSVSVACPLEDAFRVFTAEIASWWPLATKSVGLEDAVTLVIEPRRHGRVYERVRGGEEHEWGEVLAWEPPDRISFSWHPGRDSETGQEVEIRFSAAGTETRVELEHRGWERLVATADEIPAHFVSGWDEVLDRYAEAAAAGARAGT
jgi:uncharacterized protein YndB with AHSA1/START domain